MTRTAAAPDPLPPKPVILVVDDDVFIRTMAAEVLREAQLTVIEAATADEARVILESPAEVDLLFTDVQMPGSMDGIGLAQLVRNTRPGIKIVVTSGQAPQWPSVGVTEVFIGKPYAL